MPKKKNTKKTAFGEFLVEIRSSLQREGYTSKEDQMEQAGFLWDEMSAQEKEKYANIAKEKNKVLKNSDENKYTSQGISYAQINMMRELKRKAEEDELNDIKITVRNLEKNITLKSKIFHFAHVNYYCALEDGTYIPAEVALSSFSLGEGIINTYHVIISCSYPPGHAYEVKAHSEATHKIPIGGNDPDKIYVEQEKDLMKIASSIHKFLSDDDGKLAPVYTMPTNTANNLNIDCVKNIFSQFACYLNLNEFAFKVYQLPTLFYELLLKCHAVSRFQSSQVGLVSVAMAEDKLTADKFSHNSKIACRFHDEKDIPSMCSLSMITRWGFIICDYCAQFIDLELIPGKHLPPGNARIQTKFHQKNFVDDDSDDDDDDDNWKTVPVTVKQGPFTMIKTNPGVVDGNRFKDTDDDDFDDRKYDVSEGIGDVGMNLTMEQDFPRLGMRGRGLLLEKLRRKPQ